MLKNKRPAWCHLLFYFTSYVLNILRTLIYPSSGVSDCVVCGWVWVVSMSQVETFNTDTTQTQPHQISNTQRTENKTTDVVIQQYSRKLLMMDILMSETCRAHKKWNKIASDIKLVLYSSTLRISAVIYGCLGTIRRRHLGGSSSPSLFGMLGPLNTRPLGCPETSVNNYQSTQRNISEEWRYYEMYMHSCSTVSRLQIVPTFYTAFVL
jgi:hypothetical protein